MHVISKIDIKKKEKVCKVKNKTDKESKRY